ncbi:lysylphosphatidylglycerol synthase transmembrane domain-containing protein [Caulifigura coniformis]|uniref:lysylphosphatidylglycerol synthase transmembrane domain-containing protein n=1 Tax=Caulifigura coniformis TaxID=2527983 RepID=UPI0018D20CC6|nr:lysylphosphatidylglycerol synthase transmembrane domain-containing protein [Caulifigura coniformis]
MSGTSSSPRWKKWGLNLLGAAVSIGCLWWAAADMLSTPEKRAEIANAFRNANYWMLIPFWAALFGFYWLKAWRWRLLLKPLGDFRPLRDLIRPILIGFGYNNVLPAHLGEFVRVFVMGRKHRLPMTAVLSSVVLERVFDIFAIVAFMGLGLLFVPDVDPDIKRYGLMGAASASVLVAGAFLFVIWTDPFVRLFEAVLSRIPFLPKGLAAKLAGLLESAADGLHSLHSPGLLIGIFGSSLAQWALNGWMMYLALQSFGIHESPWVSCILLAAVAFGVTVPSTPGYVGVIQALFWLVLRQFTDDKAGVLGASIVYQFAQWVPVTVLGLYFFSRTGLKVSQVQQAAETTPDTHLAANAPPAS